MSLVRYDTLANRLRLHLMENPRIGTEAEASAEINLMSNVELVEVLSHVLDVRELEEAPPPEKTLPHFGAPSPRRPA